MATQGRKAEAISLQRPFIPRVFSRQSIMKQACLPRCFSSKARVKACASLKEEFVCSSIESDHRSYRRAIGFRI
jgi:hypothetical protein